MRSSQVCVSSDTKEVYIEEQRCENGELHKDIAERVVVYVGVNNKMIDTEMNEKSNFRKEHEIGVEKIYKPTRWEGNS